MPAITGGITDVVEAVAAEAEARWQPAAPDKLERAEFAAVFLEDLAGRRAWVFQRGEAQVGKAGRKVNLMEYRVSLVFAEKYPDAGEVPAAWLDEWLDWVRRTFLAPLGDEQRRPVLAANKFARACWPQRAELMEPADREANRREKLFLCLVELDYRRTVRADT